MLFAIEDHKKVAEGCSSMTKEISDMIHDQIAEIVKIIPAGGNEYEGSDPMTVVLRWNPIKSRKMDEEERRDLSEFLGYDVDDDEAIIYVSPLPDDGQEVLVCNRYGDIRIDKFVNDPDYGCAFEENGEMDGITAWMPLPEPYKEKDDG